MLKLRLSINDEKTLDKLKTFGFSLHKKISKEKQNNSMVYTQAVESPKKEPVKKSPEKKPIVFKKRIIKKRGGK